MKGFAPSYGCVVNGSAVHFTKTHTREDAEQADNKPPREGLMKVFDW